MELITGLGGMLWSGLFFVIALSVIVAVHEYGHYIVGRWCGIHAEVFSLGFGPVLLSRRDRRGTRWQIAAIPFGGYVKFLGDADAASVTTAPSDGLSPAERRHTMAGAPLWARALTVAAGPFANFLLTFVLLAGMMLALGVAEDRPAVGRLLPIPAEQTLQPGDVILDVDGIAVPDAEAFGRALERLPRQPVIPFTVLRDGQEIALSAPHPQPAIVASVQVKSAAMDAGLRAGDVILRADGRPIVTFADLQDVVFGSEGRPVTLEVWREGGEFALTLTPRRRDQPTPDGSGFETRWMVGIASGLTFEPATRIPGPLEAATRSLSQMGDMVATTFSGLWHMVAGRISTCNMSGPVGMAETMGDAARAGAQSFLSMLAVLSLGIGILNLFPVPVLDGGHLVFHAYEAVMRRPPSEAALRRLMMAGLAILIALMAFALWQDATCI